jgi:hypothetical protein
VGLGLTYFPSDDEGVSCTPSTYSTPAVPVAALPGVSMAIVNSIKQKAAGGGTPTIYALQGAYEYAKQREMMTGRRLAVALASDGLPNACSGRQNNVMTVSAAAATGLQSGIFTFVIGVGAKLDNLNMIAAGGGTKMAYLVTNATADQLLAAFKMVQSQATKLACSFKIPPPPAGMSLDPAKVNVRFNATDATKSFDLRRVMDRAACGTEDAWYYDNPTAPTAVNLCDAACQKVNGSGEGQISLLFGCAGIVIQ